MDEFIEFEGKSIDEAISNACSHYKVERSKLEIEIIKEAKAGIFGLVGNKKALIKARCAGNGSFFSGVDTLEQEKDPGEGSTTETAAAPDGDSRRNERKQRERKPLQHARRDARKPDRRGRDRRDGDQRDDEQRADAGGSQRKEARKDARTEQRTEQRKEQRKDRSDTNDKPAERKSRSPRPQRKSAPRPAPGNRKEEAVSPDPSPAEAQNLAADLAQDLSYGEYQGLPQQQYNPELMKLLKDTIIRLVAPIVGTDELDLDVEFTGDRVKITVNDEEHSGLIIGREGQTLSSIQYLANRIVAKSWDQPLRIQLDTGDYRERQDDNLRQLAFHLADKVRENGRPQSTKPLSSYHRRVVHMALQSEDGIHTRSKGEGPLKRVLILPKRDRRSGNRPGNRSGNR